MPSKARKVIETLFRIYDKEGELVDFIFNDIQIKIDEEVIMPIEKFKELYGQNAEIPEYLKESLKASILKYRQGGVTTLIMAWFLVECMNHYNVAVMLTHDKEHSERLLYRARLMMKMMKGPKPATNKLNDNEISFEKTNSLFYIGTAGSKEFGRSATITLLHCSEIAFWVNVARLMKSLFQAVPKKTGIVIQETTANGWGNWFQKSYYNYLTGKGGFKPLFYAWYIHQEYVSTTPYSPEWDAQDFTEITIQGQKVKIPNEKILYKRIKKYNPKWSKEYIITKLQWRREKIYENLGDKSFRDALKDFQQEYPSTYEEAFTVTGGSLFSDVRHRESSLWLHTNPDTMKLSNHPVLEYEYAIGADYAGGTGNDSCAMNILCLQTREQVLRFSSNTIAPIDFTNLLATTGIEYNNAFLVPEANAHGLSCMTILKRIYDTMRIYKNKILTGFTNAQMNIASYGYGWQTQTISKPYMVGIGQQFLKAGWIIYDITTEDELRSITEDPETKKIEGVGSHDDVAMSLFLAFIGILKLLRLKGIFIQDYEGTENAIIPDLPQEVIEVKVVQENKQPKWRNDQGQFLVKFDDMFKSKKRR